jgi:hypothetical protein
MAQKQPEEADLLRLKDSPRRTDLQKATRPIDRLLELFR